MPSCISVFLSVMCFLPEEMSLLLFSMSFIVANKYPCKCLYLPSRLKDTFLLNRIPGRRCFLSLLKKIPFHCLLSSINSFERKAFSPFLLLVDSTVSLFFGCFQCFLFLTLVHSNFTVVCMSFFISTFLKVLELLAFMSFISLEKFLICSPEISLLSHFFCSPFMIPIMYILALYMLSFCLSFVCCYCFCFFLPVFSFLFAIYALV